MKVGKWFVINASLRLPYMAFFSPPRLPTQIPVNHVSRMKFVLSLCLHFLIRLEECLKDGERERQFLSEGISE